MVKKSAKKKSAARHVVHHSDAAKKVEKLNTEAKRASQPSRTRHSPMLMNEREIAQDFATRVHQKFDRLIKASVLFGSQAKKTSSGKSDVDIILIVDDAAVQWDLELVAWYREELAKLVRGSTYGRDLHVNSIRLTTWWQDLIEGDPVVVNVLRYGEVLIDSGGFFNPLKVLLQEGKIKSTVESVYAALQRAPMHLLRSKANKVGAIEGIYWAMVDAAQAALVTAGKLPPSPEHLPMFLKETFVETGMCKEEYAYAMRDIFTLHKRITYGEIRDVRGSDLDTWYETAENFVFEMTRLIDEVIEHAKQKHGEERADSESTSALQSEEEGEESKDEERG